MFRISTHLASRLKHHACNSLSSAYLAAEVDITANNVDPRQRESRHVAHLCREIGILAGTWRTEIANTLPSVTLSMSSVFTHQSPYVTWVNGSTPKPRCELADLLVAVIDKTGNDPTGYATLIQAKMSKHGTVKPSSLSEKKQFELLTRRPIFDVVTKPSPTQINLQRNSLPDSALLYGLATKRPYPHIGLYCHPWWQETWLVEDQLSRFKGLATVTASDCLASVFVGLLQGSIGWQFDFPPLGQDWQHFSTLNPRDHWSELINYLLANTFAKVLKKGHSLAAGRKARGQEEVLCLVSTSPLGNKMAFLTTSEADSHLQRYFEDNENADLIWEETSFQNLMEGDGGLGGGDRIDRDESNEGGPISAVVIEVTRRD